MVAVVSVLSLSAGFRGITHRHVCIVSTRTASGEQEQERGSNNSSSNISSPKNRRNITRVTVRTTAVLDTNITTTNTTGSYNNSRGFSTSIINNIAQTSMALLQGNSRATETAAALSQDHDRRS